MPTELTPVAISALPAASALSDADIFPVVQAGVTKKATKAQVAFGISGVTSARIINVTTDSLTVIPAGTYLQAIIVTGSTGNVKIGTTEGGGELMDDSISTGTPLVYALISSPFFASETTIYFTGTFKARLLLWLIGE